MTGPRPRSAFVRMASVLMMLLLAIIGGAGTLGPSHDADEIVTVELEWDAQKDPERDGDRSDDDDDADADDVTPELDMRGRSAPPPDARFAHPAHPLDRLFRPPIA